MDRRWLRLLIVAFTASVTEGTMMADEVRQDLRRPRVTVGVERRARHRDPLWWLISVLPVAFLLRFLRGASRNEMHDVALWEWLGLVVLSLVCATLVAVVLLGVRETWRSSTRGAWAEERDEREARSSGVAQLLVGVAVLLLIGLALVFGAVTAFR